MSCTEQPTVENNITKSPQDEREYRFMKLHNGLKVLLVSDVVTEKAAAALAVRVGHLSDPEDLPGLAHFCEHMLFLGTEKYPSENEYTEFLSHHGGSANAYTSSEYTTFFFDVASEHLHGALDRFAQFFISPLFNADAKDREVNAVDSENDKNLQVDTWRFRQVLKETSRPGHPHRKFGSGNRYTLETHPAELGIDVREELLKFHSSHYSSNLMGMVILGKESLDELAAVVVEMFSCIINNNVAVHEFPEHPYSDNELQCWIEFAPVKELRQMKMEFPLPDLMEYYYCDPTYYVAHLIGHEGPGSLLSYLKGKGWCNSLSAGPAAGAKGYMFFDIGMELAEEGENHIEDIITAVFQYVAMVRKEGPQEWIFKECAEHNAVDFRFKDKQRPSSCVRTLVTVLHDFPPCDLLSARYLLTQFRPDLVQLVLDRLQPQYLRVAVISKRFEGKTEHTERWYGSGYNFKKIDSKLIEQWGSVETIEDLHLPPVNEFIPTDFEIVPLEENSPSVPTLIQDTAMTRVWYKQDDTFFLPKAFLAFEIVSPVAYHDPTSCGLATLLIWVLTDALNEYAYNAAIAGISYKIRNSAYGITVDIGGYNHKQAILLSKIMDKVTRFTVDPKRFTIQKEMVVRMLRNFKAEQPHQHAFYYTSVLILHPMWTKEELAQALEDVTAEQLQAFIPSLFSRVYIEALLHGNISKKRCLELVGIVEDALRDNVRSQPLLPSEIVRHRQVQLPDQSSYIFTATNEVHNSCCIQLYLQTGLQATGPNMLLELLIQTLAEPCFNTLRTKEQLGYIVATGVLRAQGVQGLRFIVQSEKEPLHVEKRVEAFLRQQQQTLEALSAEEFEKHKQALTVRRSEKPKKLKDEFYKHLAEILCQEYHFNRDEVEVAYLKDITKNSLVSFFQDFIALDAPHRHKLTVHVVPLQNSKNHVATDEVGNEEETTDSDEPDLAEAVMITDHLSFKNRLPLYPRIKPYTPIKLP